MTERDSDVWRKYKWGSGLAIPMTSSRLGVALLLLLPLAPTLAADTGSVHVPEYRIGDTWSIHTVETVTIPSLGGTYTYSDEYTESTTVALGRLRHAEGEALDVAWMNRSIQLTGYERPFFSRAARDLATGDALLSPAILSYRYGPSSFSLLGIYEREDSYDDRIDYEYMVRRLTYDLRDVVGDAGLAPGASFARSFAAGGVQVDVALAGDAFETLAGRTVLKATLTEERTEDGVAFPAQTATVWLADDVPVPVRTLVAASAHPVAYRRTSDLLAFSPGTTSFTIAHGPRPPAVELGLERGPVTRDGPADGSVRLDLPLSEAVAAVRSPLGDPFADPDAVVVQGAYLVTPTARGRIASWELELMGTDGSTFTDYRVTREFDALLPVPIDRVETTTSGVVFGGRPPPQGGLAGLTVAGIATRASDFTEADATPAGFGFAVWSTSTQPRFQAGTAQTWEASDGTATNGRTRATTLATVFDGFDGLGIYHAWYDQDTTRSTRLVGLPLDMRPV